MITNLIAILAQNPLLPASSDAPKAADEAKKTLNYFEGLSFNDAIEKLANSMIEFAFKLIIAILVFYLGRFLIKKLHQMVLRLMIRRNVDASLTTFIVSLVKMVLYFILIVTVIGIIGIETSSFLALFASAGVAIGMALSGTLQNFAGGVLILLLKPYKVGDFIETQGYSGTVKAIQIFYTVINTPDNKAIIIPNGGLSTGTINNFSFESYRRVDWTIGLCYGTDFDAAQKAMLEIIKSDPRVVEKYIEDDRLRRAKQLLEQTEKDDPCLNNDSPECLDEQSAVKKSFWTRIFRHRPSQREQLEQQLRERIKLDSTVKEKIDCSPFVGISELAASSVNFTIRAWVLSSEYWPLFFEMNQRLYTELPQKGFDFPFPQLDVHLHSAQP